MIYTYAKKFKDGRLPMYIPTWNFLVSQTLIPIPNKALLRDMLARTWLIALVMIRILEIFLYGFSKLQYSK